MISIVNYGVANVGSMLNMMKKLGIPAETITTPDEVRCAEKIILPGIGAFDQGMAALIGSSLAEPLKNRVLEARVPLLGVCLGMQMLGYGSEEGRVEGLGLIEGTCRRFQPNGSAPIRIPHMGWNEITVRRSSPLLRDLDHSRFYFVHSYHFVCKNSADELASSEYGSGFTAVIHRDNIWGVQFHPEKSHRFGMTLLRNFADL